jgi:hypothetical protein
MAALFFFFTLAALADRYDTDRKKGITPCCKP